MLKNVTADCSGVSIFVVVNVVLWIYLCWLTFQRALAEARRVFNDNAIGDEDMKKAHQARFEENVKLRFSQFHDKKIAEANAAIDRMLYEANNHFQKVQQFCGQTCSLPGV